MDTPAHPDVRLSRTLSALSSATRVALMRVLRRPRILAEIEVRPPEGPDRNLARQTVRQHLDLLLESGLVLARETERERGETHEFVVNHQAVYALAEDVRNLARLRPLVEPDAPTSPGEASERPVPRGPCLLVAKGLEEGAFFDLTPAAARREWVIGRRRSVEVPLDFDPYISGENARVTWEDGAHHLEDLPGSRNGTTLNFRALAAGERARLRQGDVVGVGRTVLVYWA